MRTELPKNFIAKRSALIFSLHPLLEAKTMICDLPLSRVLLENSAYYPWVFLVPRRPNVARIMDLSHDDQIQLLKEMDFAQKIMWEEFKPQQLNVAAIGIRVPQLHVHVIARFESDPAWPGTMWDHPVKQPLEAALFEQRCELLSKRFAAWPGARA